LRKVLLQIFIFIKKWTENDLHHFSIKLTAKKYFLTRIKMLNVSLRNIYESFHSAIEKRTFFPLEETVSLIQSFFSNYRMLNCLFRNTPYDDPSRLA